LSDSAVFICFRLEQIKTQLERQRGFYLLSGGANKNKI